MKIKETNYVPYTGTGMKNPLILFLPKTPMKSSWGKLICTQHLLSQTKGKLDVSVQCSVINDFPFK